MKGQGPIDSTNSTTFGDLIISTVVEEPVRQSSPGAGPRARFEAVSLLRRFGSALNPDVTYCEREARSLYELHVHRNFADPDMYPHAKERWTLKSFATAKSKITGKTRVVARMRPCAGS